MKLSHDSAITNVILAACYCGVVIMMGATAQSSYAVLNPAIGLCTLFVMLFNGQTDPFKYFWIYLAFPIAGALLGVMCYELVYRKIAHSVEEAEVGDDEKHENSNERSIEGRREKKGDDDENDQKTQNFIEQKEIDEDDD